MRHLQTRLPDEAATAALGAALARALQPGVVLHLRGELGAGKTALTRALVHAAGHSGRVKSPTYTLAEPYRVRIGDRMVELIHFDLYRLAGPDEFLDAGFRDYFNGDNVCIVEWPEKAQPALPAADIEVRLTVCGESREVELHALSDKGLQCLDRLHFAPNL